LWSLSLRRHPVEAWFSLQDFGRRIRPSTGFPYLLHTRYICLVRWTHTPTCTTTITTTSYVYHHLRPAALDSSTNSTTLLSPGPGSLLREPRGLLRTYQ